MNKDLDERLVPNGQYRDALNIQISTSDDSNVGSAQTLLGNTLRNTIEDGTYSIPTTSTCIGSIALPETDKLYYMIAGGINNTTGAALDIQRDYIIEYDSLKKSAKYVFVDIYNVTTTASAATSNANTIKIPDLSSATINKTGVRIGMKFTHANYSIEDNITVTDIAYDTGNSRWTITLSESVSVSSSDSLFFTSPRVLNFDRNNIITAINILDDFIFWTDNATEPKKISIKRSIAGTGGTEYLVGGGIAGFNAGTPTTATFEGDTHDFHTRLVSDSDNDGDLEVVTDRTGKKAAYVAEKNITVIKKSPTQPLTLEMSDQKNPRVTSSGTTNLRYTSLTFDFSNKTTGDDITPTFDNPIDYRVGDILILTDNTGLSNSSFSEAYSVVRAVVTSSQVTNPNALQTSNFTLRILSISNDIKQSSEPYYVRMIDADPLFEFKFVRFSYRYKYTDGEYSCFAPFSELAFMPGDFDYEPRKGYNLGMRNRLRSLKLKDYFPETLVANDVVGIDLLYKEDTNPTVYTVKSLTYKDEHPSWPDLLNNAYDRGEYDVTSDVIHAVLPSNQLLRPFDNVPRLARAQEISANRLIYANYLQNYNADDPVLEVSKHSQDIENVVNSQYAVPSIKSMRTYQVGVVFSDEYGRETPVLTSKNSSIKVEKNCSTKRNRIYCRLQSDPPAWAKHFSFYVKETSSEYYNMAMDRWYPASDGNIWLSFPSAERNKIIEDDYLILKKSHRTNEAVYEKARYKIIAIENEAPDFIKTQRVVLGTVLHGDTTVIGSSSAQGNFGNNTGTGGYPIPGFNKVTVARGAFIESFGEKVLVSTPDKLFVKIFTSDNASEEYEVMNLSDDNTYITINIFGAFGNDMAFTDSDGDSSNGINPPSGLALRLTENKIENKPEFDGRFFVKIFRDESLAKYVLTVESEDTNYLIKDSWQVRYINNNGYLGGPSTGPITPDYRQALKTESFNRSGRDHPTELIHHYTGSPAAAYQWGGSSGEKFGLTSGLIHADPVYALGDNVNAFSGHTTSAKRFWRGVAAKHSFFIDAATAYTWSGYGGVPAHVPGDRVNGSNGQGFHGLSVDAQTVWYESNENFTSNKKATATSANINNQTGPAISRGIWGFTGTGITSRCYMDLSWSGMEGRNNWSPPYKHKLSEHPSGVRADAWKFIQRLVTAGTKFRFRRDPDKTVYTTFEYDYQNTPHGKDEYKTNTSPYSGSWGIRNCQDGSNFLNLSPHRNMYRGFNMRQRWTIGIQPAIGSGVSGYNPITGTISGAGNSVRALKHDFEDFDIIEIVEPITGNENVDSFTESPAIWEVEPRESVDLDIYYQASGLMPVELNSNNNEEYIPIGATFQTINSSGDKTTHTIYSWNNSNTITFTPTLPANTTIADNQTITFYKRNHYWVGSKVDGQVTSGTQITLHGDADSVGFEKLTRQYHMLDWSNCFSYGNGVETDRIRDSFNQPKIANGVKASTVLAEPVKEERRKHGLIFSGIYNSNSGINNTNQFIAAEKITKDLNPVYGSIQKLHTRNTDLITLCEDKVLKVLTNKDALFNADGKANVTSNNMVLGQATPYSGDYGISTNPESFTATPQQLYFADITRGQILAMSSEGVRSISDLGMKDYFTDLLKDYADIAIGSYDEKKKEYNITIGKRYIQSQLNAEYTTVTYSEKARGWVSLKSFTPEQGLSLNNEYYTFKNGQLYIHHDNTTRNNFYGVQYDSTVTVVFNDMPEAVKSFGALNYEGTQARITQFTTSNATAYNNSGGSSTVTFNDGEYYNLDTKTGWYVDSIITNKQTGNIVEFKEKEGKWFGLIAGDATTLSNLDEREFSVQGLGNADFVHSNPGGGGGQPETGQVDITWANNTSTTYQGEDGSGGAWDTASIRSFSVTSVSNSYNVGATIGAQTIDLIISPLFNGSFTHAISATDFKIGGASETSSNSGIWQGGNVDGSITQVQFTDLGIAGDPSNTIQARISMPQFTVPTSNKTYYIDIDEETSMSNNNRNLCVRVKHPYDSNQTVSYPAQSPYGATISRTQEVAGSSTVPTKQKYQSSTILDGGWSHVVKVTFSAGSGYYYSPINTSGGLSVSSNNIVQPGFDYSSYYSTTIDAAVYDSDGRLTGFTVNINYEPPPNAPLNPDPSHLCKLYHTFVINSTLNAIPTLPSNQIQSVNFTSSAPTTANSTPVSVSGTVGASYTIQVTEQQGLESNSVATSNGYYNFTDNVFQTSSTNSGTQTISSEGFNIHNVTLPTNTSGKKRFDVIIAAAGSPQSTLHADVPNAHGEAKIIQDGIATLTLGTFTHTASNFGSMVTTTATMPTGSSLRPTVILATGGTAGVSTTALTLDEATSGIEVGMIITGTGVPYNTTVSAIDKENVNITTSQNVSVTDGVSLAFNRNDSTAKQFELTVTPGSGKSLSITSSGGRQPLASDVATSASAVISTSGSHSSGVTTLNLSTTTGLIAGMTFAVGGTTHTVSTISSATAITFTPALTANIAAPTNIEFSKTNNSASVNVRFIEAAMDQQNVKVRGLLEISSIPENDTINIFIDNFISSTS